MARSGSRDEGVAAVRRTIGGIVAGALLVLTGCQGDGGNADAETAATPTPVEVSVTPEDGAADVSPTVPLEISVTGGTVSDATLVDGDGTEVDGELADSPDDPAVEIWTPSDPLAYGTTYTLSATAEGDDADADEAHAEATFTTVTPDLETTPSIGPLNGTTVGVGMPIRVYFDQPVADQAAVERALTVESSAPTDGVWSWLSDTEVHFRPSTYWPADTDVTLHADLYGVDFGDGVWGEKDREVSFHVGASHVSVADAATHVMDVYDGGVLVQSYPMSAGSDANPTHNGAHVVLESYRNITMDSSTFGLAVDAPGGYRADVEYAVRISNNGEFVHGAPWSVADQGNANVSHGCINLATDRAAWFYGFAIPGDVVEVKNSIGGTLGPADGDIYDWAVPWEQWQAGSALS